MIQRREKRYNPENVEVWRGIATTLLRLSKFGDALLAVERYLQESPFQQNNDSIIRHAFSGIYDLKATILEGLERFEEANQVRIDSERIKQEELNLIKRLDEYIRQLENILSSNKGNSLKSGDNILDS